MLLLCPPEARSVIVPVIATQPLPAACVEMRSTSALWLACTFQLPTTLVGQPLACAEPVPSPMAAHAVRSDSVRYFFMTHPHFAGWDRLASPSFLDLG